MLTRLCASVPVDVMAGPGDPCCMYMPQQPLLPCLLPSAKNYNTLRTTTNPYAASIDVRAPGKDKGKAGEGEGSATPSQGILVMGSSGAPRVACRLCRPCARGLASSNAPKATRPQNLAADMLMPKACAEQVLP